MSVTSSILIMLSLTKRTVQRLAATATDPRDDCVLPELMSEKHPKCKVAQETLLQCRAQQVNAITLATTAAEL